MKLKDTPLAADVRVAEKEVEKCIIVTGNFMTRVLNGQALQRWLFGKFPFCGIINLLPHPYLPYIVLSGVLVLRLRYKFKVQ